MGDFLYMGEGGQADKHTKRQTHRHINNMTLPGLRAGPSEKTLLIPAEHQGKLGPLVRV